MKNVLRWIAVLLMALLVLIGLAGPAAAAPVIVIDEARTVDDAALVAAAAPITDVEFVVIVVDTEEDLLSDLDRLGYPEANFPANTIVLALNVETRDVGVYGPDDHLKEVDSDEVIDEMVPALRDDKWTSGLIAGMEQVDRQLHPSRTWLWVLLGVAVAAAGFFGMAAFVRRLQRRAAEKKAAEARAEQTAKNNAVAVEIRRRLDELAVLILTVADGPARDPLEVKLNDVDVAITARESKDQNLTGANPDFEKGKLEALTAALDDVLGWLTVLRQDTGWQDQWRAMVAAVGAQAQELTRDQRTLGTVEGYQPVDMTLAGQRIADLLDVVLTGTTPVAVGVAELASLSAILVSKENEADRLLEYRQQQAENARRAAENARRAEMFRAAEYESGGDEGYWGSWGSGGGYRRSNENSGWSWLGGSGSSGGSSSRRSSPSRSGSRRSFSSSRSGSSRSSSSSRSGSSRRF